MNAACFDRKANAAALACIAAWLSASLCACPSSRPSGAGGSGGGASSTATGSSGAAAMISPGGGTGGSGSASGGSGGTVGRGAGTGGAGLATGGRGAGAGGCGGLNLMFDSVHVRVANMVVMPSAFDAFGRDTHLSPIALAHGIGSRTVSDYFDVGYESISPGAEFVLFPVGQMPDPNNCSWINLSPTATDRTVVQINGVKPNQYFTEIVTWDAANTTFSIESLDETHLQRGDATKANLHLDWQAVFDIPGSTAVPKLAVVGQPCLPNDSIAVQDVISVAPGHFELGIYDLQNASDCTELMAKVALDGAAGDNLLIVVYLDGSTIKFLTAPLAMH